jgi:urease accessory protein UreF
MVFCHGHAVSVLGAASRLMPFSHTQAQQILRRLHPLLNRLSGEIGHRRWPDMTAFTPELDLVSMSHETDELRLFAS